MSTSTRRLAIGAIAVLVACDAVAAGKAVSVSIAQTDAMARLLSVPQGGSARIERVPLGPGSAPTVSLTLERFSVFAADARVHVHGNDGTRTDQAPDLAHFRGSVEGNPDSFAFWSGTSDGSMRGIIHVGADVYVVDAPGPSSTKATRARKVDRVVDRPPEPFTCGVQHGRDPITGAQIPQRSTDFVTKDPSVAATSTPYDVRIAVETDYEYFQLFGSAGDATRYTADLLAYVSTIYSTNIQANLKIGDLFLYSTAADPWTATSSVGMLNEVKSFWSSNRGNINRALVHFLSGKGGGNGLAYLDVLCDNLYAYSITPGLWAIFDPDSPRILWDTMAVGHEIGHIFGSDHTHCYAGIGGSGSPVDGCYNFESGCYSGPADLPGVGSITGGTPRTGAGTLMSYCHLYDPGGYTNVGPTFGLNHVYGVAADRVPTLMRSRLEAAVATSAACFVDDRPSLLVHKSGLGTVTSSPPGINCGDQCFANYAPSTTVTLTASPMVDTVFSHWSGDCSGSGSCTVPLNAAKTVTANFLDGFPTNGALPQGWVQVAGSYAPWSVTTVAPFGAPYSLRSGPIIGGKYSAISYTGQFNAGTVRFARRVSSEPGYDYLQFFIDGVKIAEWSGSVAWGVVSYPIMAGSHTLKWQYIKDFSDPGEFIVEPKRRKAPGDDTGWIDYVNLPLASTSVASEVTFTPVTPCRLVDTRNAIGPLSPRSGRGYAAGDVARIAQAGGIASGGCGIPAEASALVLTLTAVAPPQVGNLVLFPAGPNVPLASALNFGAGQIVANTTVVPIVGGSPPNFSIFNNSDGATSIVVDVVGYFALYAAADCATVTQSQSVASGSSATVTASCAIGYSPAGGGCSVTGSVNWLDRGPTGGGNGFACTALNSTGSPATVSTSAKCCRTAGR